MDEPVAFFNPHKGFYWAKPTNFIPPVTVDVEPLALYTQRTWVGLTDQERNKLWRDVVKWGDPSHDDVDLMKAIEAKLKEKNT